MNNARDLWVFGYGSLMWRPGFEYLERIEATLFGYHRAFCVYSYVHRGTPERPGLVFGLDRGGSCRGIAYRVAADMADEVRRYLIAREQVTMVYLEARRKIRLADGRVECGLCFLVDRGHEQYAGKLDFIEQVRLIARSSGQSGPNWEYLANTISHFDAMGIPDGPLHALNRAVAAVGRQA